MACVQGRVGVGRVLPVGRVVGLGRRCEGAPVPASVRLGLASVRAFVFVCVGPVPVSLRAFFLFVFILQYHGTGLPPHTYLSICAVQYC